ncbi:hypothetical protein PHELEMICH_38 [Mycobacterium phage Phelemich]|uniref:Tail assembly chaperone n=2 Tax=Acadianvirus reprobate TaxID=1982903 RepID=S5Y7Q3_9CAUD|nr:hypothetical protein N847_gp38 [Mycobacterium phage Phelemich]YP_008409959.1 hypothetical protein REPROBATE_38 [Mycobacterium phage Reprobate]AGT12774.1 hypothetical protein REPROBATE_38 [Mycobacterium phage Reprobate]AGT13952.1 hypothetical protein PHELEMICH_38 [Mycobacterium phage Phelemich]
MGFEPPAGYLDCEADGEAAPPNTGPFHEIEVADVGVIHARRPLPNAIPALSAAANPKVTDVSRLGHLNLFVQNHLAEGEFEHLLMRMMDPDQDLPPDTMLRVSRAIATAGTARPT